ncbi:MAG: archaellin/type IV pilin N-terminal domain-containing protein [Candidatus Micrarchaeota archaeon]
MNQFAKGKKGAVGIGTLIIFIAMVLVAAIAAAVLINVSGILQQRAMTTGKESIEEVSSNVIVKSITGNADSGRTTINSMNITVTNAAGSQRMDLRQLIIKVSNGMNQTIQQYSSSGIANGVNFTAIQLRDPSNVFTTTNPVMDSSTLVLLNVVPTSVTTNVSMPPRTPYRIEMIPERGVSVVITGTTPASYSLDLIELYP